jgi:hypothetical protein
LVLGEAQQMDTGIEAIRTYWNTYPLRLQYVSDPNIKPDTLEFFEHIRPWLNPKESCSGTPCQLL